MNAIWPSGILTLALGTMLFAVMPASAQVLVQCPGDTNGDAKWDNYCAGNPSQPCTRDRDCNPAGPADLGRASRTQPVNTQCMSLTGGDGFATMADGGCLYTFSFSDVTGVPATDVMTEGLLAAAWPAPVIAVDQGEDFYLTLTNVGMLMRPDLFDPHTVHFHGFPNASSVFDGLPESAIAINMGASLTYYYHLVSPAPSCTTATWRPPSTCRWACSATSTCGRPRRTVRSGPVLRDRPCTKYVYNDGDGSTRYDVEFALQLGGFDHVFHEEHVGVQPLPFAMKETYPMINGRGYPDTINPDPLPGPERTATSSPRRSRP